MRRYIPGIPAPEAATARAFEAFGDVLAIPGLSAAPVGSGEDSA
jgi:hypothetical protein